MILLIDIGNSCVKYATAEAHVINSQHRLCYNKNNLAKRLSRAWSTLPKIQQVWVSNVAGKRIAKILKKQVKLRWSIFPRFIKSSAYACGISNTYEKPELLGVDRWLAVIGARHLKQGTLCIVDCGTAVTVDVLSQQNQYLGGVIVAGREIMQAALLKKTDALARASENKKNVNNQVLGKNTYSGIQLGSQYAIVGLIESMMKRLEKQGEMPQLILTGGSLPALLPLLTIPYYHSPDLVLRGLWVLANTNYSSSDHQD